MQPSGLHARCRVLSQTLSQGYLDRFSGLARLYGKYALPRLRGAHVAVIGLGGVGSWTVEALTRSGIGKITLIDLDDICITNSNRQLPALEGQIGRPKVVALAERMRLINPEIEIQERVKFFTKSTAGELLCPTYDCIIDGIDLAEHKAFLVVSCLKRKIPLVVAGGAGGKQDPAAVSTADLAFTTNDRLLKLVRRDLRNHYGFPREEAKAPIGVRAVFSSENAKYPWEDGSVRADPEPGSHLRLNCDTGFGSAAPVTGTFGFAAASEAIRIVLEAPEKKA